MSNIVLQGKNLYKSFKKGSSTVNVLVNFSMELKDKDFVAVVGPSGSGKSTLLHILGGLEKPDGGEIFYKDKNIHSEKSFIDVFRNEHVGFIFQFHYLLNDFNALENVMMPALVMGKSRTEAKKDAEFLLSKVGLESRTTHFPTELSGGEQQRVAIARALVNNPQILLADEPTGNLDRENSISIFEIFKQLNDEGLTILLVTHDNYLASMTKNRLELSKD